MVRLVDVWVLEWVLPERLLADRYWRRGNICVDSSTKVSSAVATVHLTLNSGNHENWSSGPTAGVKLPQPGRFFYQLPVNECAVCGTAVCQHHESL